MITQTHTDRQTDIHTGGQRDTTEYTIIRRCTADGWLTNLDITSNTAV